MKKNYVAPTMVCEEFAANEYVAACGEQNTKYKFECNALAGTLYYYPDSDGEIDGEYTGTGEEKRLGRFSPCPAWHEASTTDAFYDGYIKRDGKRYNVIVWRGPDGDNGHATAQLDMDEWETAKS